MAKKKAQERANHKRVPKKSIINPNKPSIVNIQRIVLPNENHTGYKLDPIILDTARFEAIFEVDLPQESSFLFSELITTLDFMAWRKRGLADFFRNVKPGDKVRLDFAYSK